MREFTPAERFAAGVMAQEDLYFFSRWMFMQRRRYQWQRAQHHKTICDALMRVFRGECTRLIINIPPRYSKTELAVVNFIAWALGKAPDAEFLHVSYSGDLSKNNSGHVQQVMLHEAYREIFPATGIASDAKHHWKTTAGGVMYTAGVGGTLTGFGAGKERPEFGGAIVIDDPHKADEARSDTIRGNVIEWFRNTLESRKNSRQTPVILIMQRLHEEDLAGWLLAGGNGETWEHLSLEALRPDGSALWEQKHTADDLRRMEQASPYTFAGQYQQRPAPAEGGIFKPGMLQVVDAAPAGAKWVRGWDLASSVPQPGRMEPDFTAGALLGRLPDGRFVIGDVVAEQMGPDDRDKLIANTAALDSRAVRISIPQDPGQAGKSQVLYLTRQLAGYTVKSSPESGDKVTRAEPFAAQVNVGNVLMVRGAWNGPLMQQMRDFPNAKHDDQIDALSRAFAEFLGPARAGIVTELSL
jgi:predicted phage terminase large subunit-like protein